MSVTVHFKNSYDPVYFSVVELSGYKSKAIFLPVVFYGSEI
jgi:hypothetical protein